MSLSRFTSVLLLFLVPGLAAFAQTTQDDIVRSIRENYTKTEVMIPMRDGVKLFTAIYTPKDASQKVPILLTRTPFSVSPYGADKFPKSLGPDKYFAREGYIFVYQDVRGKWMSEGEFEDVRPETAASGRSTIDESTDAYDTIDWLMKNVANNNGRVGVYGSSYPGFYANAAAINSHPALKACSPQAPVSDWFKGDDMHHNGALWLAQNYDGFMFVGQSRPKPTSDFGSIKEWNEPLPDDAYAWFLKAGGLTELGDLYPAHLGQRIAFWDAMMQHPNYDDFWKQRNILPHLRNIKCAVMTVGGWFDNEDLYGTLSTYDTIERQDPGIFNVLVMGPWAHNGWTRSSGEWLGSAYFGSKTSEYFQTKFELPFFNYYLKGKGDLAGIKEVNAFDTGTNTWRSFENWPATPAKDVKLYLSAGHRLDPATPKANGSDEYVSDPTHPVPFTEKIGRFYPPEFMTEDQRFAETRSDVLTYKSEILTEDMTIAGDIRPDIWMSSNASDSDLIVKLMDVFPDDNEYPEGAKPDGWVPAGFHPGGYEMLLRGDVMPLRFRNGFEKGEALVPNSPVRISFRCRASRTPSRKAIE
jgi:putative CocE/NonD family hydrolase